MRLALVLTSVLVVAAIVAAAVRSPSGKVVTARSDRSRPPAVAQAAVPRFFADTQGSGEGNGPLEIRRNGHGRAGMAGAGRYQFR